MCQTATEADLQEREREIERQTYFDTYLLILSMGHTAPCAIMRKLRSVCLSLSLLFILLCFLHTRAIKFLAFSSALEVGF